MGGKITIATLVYGDYINLFQNMCLPSLFQGGNIPRLLAEGHEIDYLIYTRNEDIGRCNEVVKAYEQERLTYHIRGMDRNGHDWVLGQIVREGVARNDKLLFLNPDFFFGNHSIGNIVQYQCNGKICVAALHMRVDSDKFTEIMGSIKKNISNAELVDIAMRCLHNSWASAFVDTNMNNSHRTGAAVQKIMDNLWAATFVIPTVFLANFNDSDVGTLTQFGFWDHTWPEKLVKEERFKFIGSSDFFFAVELTHLQYNIPPKENNRLWNNSFLNTRGHAQVNKNFLAVIRGGND